MRPGAGVHAPVRGCVLTQRVPCVPGGGFAGGGGVIEIHVPDASLYQSAISLQLNTRGGHGTPAADPAGAGYVAIVSSDAESAPVNEVWHVGPRQNVSNGEAGVVLQCPLALTNVVVWSDYADASRWGTSACLTSGVLGDIIVRSGAMLVLGNTTVEANSIVVEEGGELRLGAGSGGNSVVLKLGSTAEVRGRVSSHAARAEIQSAGNLTIANSSVVDGSSGDGLSLVAGIALAVHGRVIGGPNVVLNGAQRVWIGATAEVTSVLQGDDTAACPLDPLPCSPRAGGTSAGAGGGDPASVGRFGNMYTWARGPEFGGAARVPPGMHTDGRYAGLAGGKVWLLSQGVVLVEGAVSANGAAGADLAPGAEAGFSAVAGQSVGGGGGGWVSINGSMVVFGPSARVTANGGDGGVGATLETQVGGGGGGGYVSVVSYEHSLSVPDILDRATIQATGGKAL